MRPVTPIIEEEEIKLRAELVNINDPRLDKFRSDVRALRTHDLITFAANPKALAGYVGLKLTESSILELMLAFGCTVADEINRRIPIPDEP